MNILRKVQGTFESALVRQYRKIARDMNLQTVIWNSMEIVGEEPVVEAMSSALADLEPADGKYVELICRNIRSVLCIENALTNTFPVARVSVIAATAVKNYDARHRVALLVQSAAYIQFYKTRHIFMPKFFQRQSDNEARSEARQCAIDFQRSGQRAI